MKTDKELAVELASSYVKAIYSREYIKPLDVQALAEMLKAFYDAVKTIPNT